MFRFQVSFKDSDDKFVGSIHAVKDGNLYDVLFDELVRGQQVIEQNIDAHRIKSEDNYFDNSDNVGEEDQGVFSDEESVVGKSIAVQELLKVKFFFSCQLMLDNTLSGEFWRGT